MPDFEVLKLSGQLLRLFVELPQFGMPHLINAFHLAYHEFGIADHRERFNMVLGGITKRCNQSLILGVIVCTVPEIVAKLGNWISRRILNGNPITGRSGITPGPAVDVSSVRRRGRFGRREKISGIGRTGSHGSSLQLDGDEPRSIPELGKVLRACACSQATGTMITVAEHPYSRPEAILTWF